MSGFIASRPVFEAILKESFRLEGNDTRELEPTGGKEKHQKWEIHRLREKIL